MSDETLRGGSKPMKLSARNILKGKIVEIARASTMTRISLDIGGGNIVNAAITTVAVDDLKLAVGKEAYAVVDATNVMVGVD
jgi:molybdopterin-binding protein